MSHTFHLHGRDLTTELDERGNLLTLQTNILGEGFQAAFNEMGVPIIDWTVWRVGDITPRTNWQTSSFESSDQMLASGIEEEGIWVNLKVKQEGSLCKWQATITNSGQIPVQALDFRLRIPVRHSSNIRCTFPFCAGWALPFSFLKPEDEFTLQYPTQGAMQWVSVFTPEEGLYFGVHDPLPLYKELSLGMEGSQPFIRWRFLDLALNPGESITLPIVCLAPHRDGWRGGARIYRTWASDFVSSPSVPAWYRESPTWAWIGLKGQLADAPWHQMDYLVKMSRRVSQAKVGLVQLTAYTENGHDTGYPDYIPGDSVGGVEGLRKSVAAIHQDGRRASIYVNGRVVDPASSIEPDRRDAWAVRALPGSPPYTEQYGTVTFEVMCPGCAEWRQLFLKKLEYLVKEFDVDGIYIDQVCGCRSLPCYSTGHDHVKPNQAWSYYKEFIKGLRERLLAIKPTLFLATEGVNDLLGQYFDSMQSHNDWPGPLKEKGEPLYDLYRYTFPSHLFNVGCITGDETGTYFRRIAHLSGAGCDFGVWDWEEIPETFYKINSIILDWYKKHHAIFQQMEISTIVANPDDVQASAFYARGLIVVNAVWHPQENDNPLNKKATFQISNPLAENATHIDAFSLGERVPCAWHLEEGKLTVIMELVEIMGLEIMLGGENDQQNI